jgi:hypothetical protein
MRRNLAKRKFVSVLVNGNLHTKPNEYVSVPATRIFIFRDFVVLATLRSKALYLLSQLSNRNRISNLWSSRTTGLLIELYGTMP